MTRLWMACLLALVLATGSASATVFLYEDFEDPLSGDWLLNGLWHREDYRAYGGTYSAAFNDGGDPPSYYTGGSVSGWLVTPIIDVTGASGVYLDFWSWLETENSEGTENPPWDAAVVYLADASDGLFGYWTPDMNFGPHETWYHWESGDFKPFLDGFGYSEFRVAMLFDTSDDVDNDYEGWYVDNMRVWDGQDTPPIPEPSTWLLLSSGLIGLAGAARKRLFG